MTDQIENAAPAGATSVALVDSAPSATSLTGVPTIAPEPRNATAVPRTALRSTATWRRVSDAVAASAGAVARSLVRTLMGRLLHVVSMIGAYPEVRIRSECRQHPEQHEGADPSRGRRLRGTAVGR